MKTKKTQDPKDAQIEKMDVLIEKMDVLIEKIDKMYEQMFFAHGAVDKKPISQEDKE